MVSAHTPVGHPDRRPTPVPLARSIWTGLFYFHQAYSCHLAALLAYEQVRGKR